VEEPTITKSKEGVRGLEFKKEYAHYFFYATQIVHREFVPPNTTVNSEFYCDVLRRSRENMQRKQPQLAPSS
jgi:hypothetical protein